MNFIGKLEETIATIGIPFGYGTAEELNNLLPNIAPGVSAMCYLLHDSQMMYVGPQMCESAIVTMFFVDRTSWSFNSVENEGIIQECKAFADRWINNLRRGSIFTLTGQVNYRRVYLTFAQQTYTGIGVNLRLMENVGSCFCEQCPDNSIYVIGSEDIMPIATDDDLLIQIQI